MVEGETRAANNYAQDIILCIWIITGMACIVMIIERFIRTSRKVKLEQQFEEILEENKEDTVK